MNSSSKKIDSVPWIKAVLLFAAFYNLLFGGSALLFPSFSLQILGIESTGQTILWQCLGMVIGVYGVGYAIAAFHPFQHWPIVLVGLLGKFFGPVGFLFYAIQGTLPWKMGWMLCFNDLIWWIPFTLILYKTVQNRSKNTFY